MSPDKQMVMVVGHDPFSVEKLIEKLDESQYTFITPQSLPEGLRMYDQLGRPPLVILEDDRSYLVRHDGEIKTTIGDPPSRVLVVSNEAYILSRYAELGYRTFNLRFKPNFKLRDNGFGELDEEIRDLY